MNHQLKLFQDTILDNCILYIIGNGFDLAHSIKSSYWNFREWLVRNKYNLVGMMDVFLVIKEMSGVVSNKLWESTMKKAF